MTRHGEAQHYRSLLVTAGRNLPEVSVSKHKRRYDIDAQFRKLYGAGTILPNIRITRRHDFMRTDDGGRVRRNVAKHVIRLLIVSSRPLEEC